jgi:hypothetical protein
MLWNSIAVDTYAAKARLLPALIAVAPVGAVATVLLGNSMTAAGAVLRVLGFFGAFTLLSHIARHAGKRAEARLYAGWGGEPSTISLRHRTRDGNEPLRRHRHEQLGILFPDLDLPTPRQERANPAKADAMYRAFVARLRSATRDRRRFPLLFAENCAFGFLRNLEGLRWLGFAVAAGSTFTLACCAWCPLWLGTSSTWCALGAAACLGWSVMWLVFPRARRIRATADAYVDRLFESCDLLVREHRDSARLSDV